MLDCIDGRPADVVSSCALARRGRSTRWDLARAAGRSLQQAIEVQTKVPPGLNVLLMDSGGLVAHPGATQIRIGVA